MFNVQSSKFFKLAIAAVALASQAAFAAPVTFSGALTATDPVFNSPFSATALTTVGTAVAYDVYSFYVSANGAYSIEALGFLSANADSFLAVYKDAFNRTSPLTNLVAFDDDSGVSALSLINTTFTSGTQYFLIFTSYGNGQYGSYNGVFNTVSGGGQVSLGTLAVPGQVPEPGSLALLGLAALGLGVARRRA